MTDFIDATEADTLSSLAGGIKHHEWINKIQDAIAALESRVTPGLTKYVAGRYYRPRTAQQSNGICTLNRLGVAPFLVGGALTVDELAVIVTGTSASAIVRLGLYDSDPNTDLPKNLLADTGAVGAGSAGVKTGAVAPVSLVPGLYWIGGVVQVIAPSMMVFTSIGSHDLVSLSAIPTGTNPVTPAYYMDGISGALPATFVPLTATGWNGLFVHARAA